MTLYMVFDVESVGLLGEGFAYGAVVIDETGQEVSHTYAACHPSSAQGDLQGIDWLNEHLPVLDYRYLHPREVRADFWRYWLAWKRKGATLAADVPWPVESAFLMACVIEHPDEGHEGPYPLVDVASVRLAVMLDPLATEARLPNEQPAHDPLADARQSARLLIDALDRYEQLLSRAAVDMPRGTA